MDQKTKRIIARQINIMVSKDRKEMKLAEKSGTWDKWNKQARNNTAELKVIISRHGWLTIEKVGKRASHGAWFIVQHSDADKNFQKKILKLMKASVDRNPSSTLKSDLAFLEDRVLVNGGAKQIYGTQFYINKQKKLVPRPIRDLKTLDLRRAEYGLPPFSDYLESAKKYK